MEVYQLSNILRDGIRLVAIAEAALYTRGGLSLYHVPVITLRGDLVD